MHRPIMLMLLTTAIGASCVPTLPRCEEADSDKTSCPMPNWLDRAFDIKVPASWDGQTELPLVYVFHGGGGNRAAAERTSCPGGDTDSPACFGARATAAGYAVVFPDGTGTRPVRGFRTWNAGGGTGDWQCVSGGGCRGGADDLRYFDELHEEVGRIIPIAPDRVYATGLSNGAAFPHRLACQRANILAAIAPVGGANQHAAAGGACDAGVAVLQIHGTADPCWTYETSSTACAQEDGKLKVGVSETLAGWTERNECDGTPTEELLSNDDPDDGTETTRLQWSGCNGDIEHLRVDGGGHSWPQGYSHTDRVGVIAQDFEANLRILEFFDNHRRNQ